MGEGGGGEGAAHTRTSAMVRWRGGPVCLMVTKEATPLL